MATTTGNTLAALTNENKTFYERTLLKRLTPNLLYAKFGQKKAVIPGHEGDTIDFRRFNSLTVPANALTEGTPPTGSALSVTNITAQPEQYGDFVFITDRLDMVGIDPVLTETSELLGEQAALKIDNVVRNAILTGVTNHLYSNGTTSSTITSTDVITSDDIKKAVRSLKNANAKPYEDGYFVGIVDPDVAYDLMNDTLWEDVSKYNGGEAIQKGEIGKLCGVRFYETTEVATASENSVTTHKCLILAKESYGVVDIEGGSAPKMIVKPFGSAGTEDPLDQKATCGWKTYFTAKVLQPAGIVCLHCAVSA